MIFLYHKIAMEKYSRQRELIYHSLETRKDHPTAEELYLDLKEKMSEIGIATVYRNLSDLCQKGKIIKIKSKYGPDRFDGNLMPHIHFQCEQCNNIVDIELKSEEKEKIDNDLLAVLNKTDAILTTSEILLIGICKQCQNHGMN